MRGIGICKLKKFEKMEQSILTCIVARVLPKELLPSFTQLMFCAAPTWLWPLLDEQLLAGGKVLQMHKQGQLMITHVKNLLWRLHSSFKQLGDCDNCATVSGP